MQRSRWDIMASILRVAVTGEAKTHIMYKSNLSFRQTQSYLDLLLNSGLLRTQLREGGSSHTTIYVTTTRGRAFMKAYDNLKASGGGESFGVRKK